MYELMYEFILMSETIEKLKNKFLKWKEAFESKGLKLSLGKTKVMFNGGMFKCNVDPCEVCNLRVKVNSVFGVDVVGESTVDVPELKCVCKVFRKFVMQKM